MALIIEDSQKITQRKIPVPKNAQKVFSALYNALEPNMGKNSLKNLKNLATDKTYNKKGDEENTNGKDQGVNYVNIDVAKMRKSRWPNDPLQQMAQGGQLAYDLYDKGIERARSQEKVQPVEPPKPTSDADTKPNDAKVKNIELPSGTISYNENKVVKESFADEDNPFRDYLDEYDASYVFDEFLKNKDGKQDWGVLINPDMYAKALREFTKYGKLVNFPSKYVYQWMGIIMKNTAILVANTDIAGHSANFPYQDLQDFLESYYGDGREIRVKYRDQDIQIEIPPTEIVKILSENAVDKYGQIYFPWITQDDADDISSRQNFYRKYGYLEKYVDEYNQKVKDIGGFDYFGKMSIDYKTYKIFWIVNVFDFLYKIGLTDEWMQMPDGSDAFSDYGIKPLEEVLNDYSENLPPEKVLVLVNRALDVFHQRGDMASIFIQGGSDSLSRIAESVKHNSRKIYITEKQIINLKHG